MYNRTKVVLITIGIFLLAAFFRLYGVNWDQGQHLHPDERFLTMVANGISWPKDFGEYLDTAISPLNPHNRGFGFFVYGTFPVFFTKWVAESLGQGDYGNLTLIGRELSAFMDLGTVFLVFLIAKEISTKFKAQNPIQTQSSKSKNNSKYFGFGILKFICHLDFGIWNFPLLPMFLYSIMVLPIQLSHFYAVDTYLTFFIALSFYLLIKIITLPNILNTKYLILNTLLGISFGLALASKITAVFFLPIIGLGFIYCLIKFKNIRSFLILSSIFLILAYITFRLAQPYAFANGDITDPTLNPKVIANWKQLKSFDDPQGWFPPAVQWITTKPFLYAFKNLILWGLGLPLGIIAFASIIYFFILFCHSSLSKISKTVLSVRFWSRFAPQNDGIIIIFLSLIWIVFLFSYQSIQFSKNLRYFIPICPFLAIISAYFLYLIVNKYKINLLIYWFIGLLLIIYPVSFVSIYSHKHSRVAASEWIYQNIPSGSTTSGEHWDDYLPLSLPEPNFVHEKYTQIEFPLYGADNETKWKEMDTKLRQVDYIFLTSNRLYGSITTISNRYPQTTKFYQKLFDGSLGFEKVAEFTSRPNLPLPFIKLCLTPPFSRYGSVAKKSQECNEDGISFVDDYADESFTVYDHPKVIIFEKVKSVDYLKLLNSDNYKNNSS